MHWFKGTIQYNVMWKRSFRPERHFIEGGGGYNFLGRNLEKTVREEKIRKPCRCQAMLQVQQPDENIQQKSGRIIPLVGASSVNDHPHHIISSCFSYAMFILQSLPAVWLLFRASYYYSINAFYFIINVEKFCSKIFLSYSLTCTIYCRF